jgi:hypothetical protein
MESLSYNDGAYAHYQSRRQNGIFEGILQVYNDDSFSYSFGHCIGINGLTLDLWKKHLNLLFKNVGSLNPNQDFVTNEDLENHLGPDDSFEFFLHRSKEDPETVIWSRQRYMLKIQPL